MVLETAGGRSCVRQTASVVEVRRTSGEQWRVLRQVRLAALVDSPRSFASTLAREQAFDDAEWRRRADGACWLAWQGGRPVGTVALVPDDVSEDALQVVGMWVEATVRGTGAAAALVEAACEHARATGTSEVCLWVADGNERARRAYERWGFVATGERQPLPGDPSRTEDRMRRRLVVP